MSNALKTERRDRALIVHFTRPEIRNPLSTPVLGELNDILEDIVADDSIYTLIFTGSGESFASGADLREIGALAPGSAAGFARNGQTLMNKIAKLTTMTVAAVNGYCFGGALDLALACDRRIASPSAKFAHPGAGLGIITGWGGTQRLPRLVGEANALELFFTAEPIDATRAFQMGLVDEVASDIIKASLASAGVSR